MIRSTPGLLLGALFAGCGPTGAPVASAPPPSIELTGAETFDFQDGRLRAHGFADRVLYRRDTGDGQAAQVRLELFSSRPVSAPGAARSVLLTAPRVQGNPAEQVVHAEGGVALASEVGDRGQTERASYLGREARAFGRDPLRLWGRGYDVHAPGFELDTLHDRLDLGKAALVAGGGAP
ncbi:MAG: hypothetical protein ACYDCL_19145 [Myxococcales bacterium]